MCLTVRCLSSLRPLQVLAEVVQRISATAGSLNGWGWREMKVFPVLRFDGLARLLTKAFFAMFPKVGGDASPLRQRPLCVLPVVCIVFGFKS